MKWSKQGVRQRLRRAARRALPIEQAILPHVAQPWRAQVEELGWQPDATGTYCDRCGVGVGPHEVDDAGCAHCRGSRMPWNQFVRLSSYEEPMVGWIHQIKFTRYSTLAEQVGWALGRVLIEGGLDGKRAIITPMPTTWRRRLARGIDHAGDIARGVKRGSESHLVRLLQRSHGPSQRAVPASKRAQNVSSVFSLRAELDLRGWDVVLVDDVCTSGASLRSAARVLRKTRLDMLWVAVLAVSDEQARRARRDGRATDRTTGITAHKH